MKNKKIILYINYLVILLSASAIFFSLIKCDYFGVIVMTLSFLVVLMSIIAIVMLNSGEKQLKIVLNKRLKVTEQEIELQEELNEGDYEGDYEGNQCLKLVSDLDATIDFEELVEQKIRRLADALQIVAAITYVKNGDDLDISSCYALVKSEQKQKINVGEGLTGQVAMDGKPIEVSISDQISLEIISGLGKSKPKFLYLLPVFDQAEIRGVVELATFIKLSDARIDYLIEALKR